MLPAAVAVIVKDVRWQDFAVTGYVVPVLVTRNVRTVSTFIINTKFLIFGNGVLVSWVAQVLSQLGFVNKHI